MTLENIKSDGVARYEMAKDPPVLDHILLNEDENKVFGLIITKGSLTSAELADMGVNNPDSILISLSEKNYVIKSGETDARYSSILPIAALKDYLSGITSSVPEVTPVQPPDQSLAISAFDEKKAGFVTVIESTIASNLEVRNAKIDESTSTLIPELMANAEQVSTGIDDTVAKISEVRSVFDTSQSQNREIYQTNVKEKLDGLRTEIDTLLKTSNEDLQLPELGNATDLQKDLIAKVEHAIEDNQLRIDLIHDTINSTISLIENQYRTNTESLTEHARAYSTDSTDTLQKAANQLRDEITSLNENLAGVSDRMLSVLKEVNETLSLLGQDNRRIFVDTKNTLDDIGDGLENSLKEVETEVVSTSEELQTKFSELLDDSLREMETHISKTETEFKGIGETLQTTIAFSLQNRLEQFMEEVSVQIQETLDNFQDLIEVKTLTLKKNRIDQHNELQQKFENRMEELNTTIQTKVQSQRLQQGLKLTNLRSQYEKVTEKAENLLMGTIEMTDKEFSDNQTVIDSTLNLLGNWSVNVEQQILVLIGEGRDRLEGQIVQAVSDIEASLITVKESIESSNATMIGEMSTQVNDLLSNTKGTIQEVTEQFSTSLKTVEEEQFGALKSVLEEVGSKSREFVDTLDAESGKLVSDHLDLITSSVHQATDNLTQLTTNLSEYLTSFTSASESKITEMTTMYKGINDAEGITLEKLLKDLITELEGIRNAGIDDYANQMAQIVRDQQTQFNDLNALLKGTVDSLSKFFTAWES